MAYSNVPITPGSGANISVDTVSGVDFQMIKLDVGAQGVSAPVTAGGTNYLPVAVASVAGNVTIVPAASQQFPIVNAPATTIAISAASAIPVSAPVGSPVFVRLSDGTNPITTLPVSGTVTANQGTAASVANAWPVKISDGTNAVALTNFGGSYAANVNVVGSVTISAGAADSSAFTAGTSIASISGAVFNDGIANPTSGQSAALRMTQLRGLHVNLRNNSGTEIGTGSNPVRVDPVGTTTQPVSGTISAQVTQWGGSNVVSAAAGIPKVGISDSSGNAISDSNPVIVQEAAKFRTRVTKSLAISASQTAVAVWTPTSGKAFYVTSMIFCITGSGTFTLFDNTNTAASILTDGTVPTGIIFTKEFTLPWSSAAANNVLRYTTGTGTAGTLTVHGYEA